MYFNSNPEESKKARDLLSRGPKLLEAIDNAYIIKQRGHTLRPMPKFKHEEIEIGNILGVGGFGVVSEITAFELEPEEEEEEEADHNNKDTDPNSEKEKPEQQIENGNDNDNDNDNNNSNNSNNNKNDNANDDQKNDQKDNNNSDKENNTTIKKGGDDGKPQQPKKAVIVEFADPVIDDENVHYDISKARELMSRRCIRKGGSRYAIKRLHGDLSELEQARGKVDLAIEAKYLSVVWHPNIVKMRGLAVGGLMDEDFFIIMDRLYGTLGHRMKSWCHIKKKNKGMLGGLIGKNKKVLDKMLLERMIIAYDLSVAFWYLHENRLVYRDIKPENIGFDFRGDVKVFDFGLCKSLDPRYKCQDGRYGYRMTGRAGSLPYMSPEVAQCKTYDTKCDVYSFAVLLWEILALKPAFDGYNHKMFMDQVCVKKERPKVNSHWPPLTRLVLPEAWDHDPSKRPDMKRIAIMIRGDLNEMSSDENVLHRTMHMDDRSNQSLAESEKSLTIPDS